MFPRHCYSVNEASQSILSPHPLRRDAALEAALMECDMEPIYAISWCACMRCFVCCRTALLSSSCSPLLYRPLTMLLPGLLPLPRTCRLLTWFAHNLHSLSQVRRHLSPSPRPAAQPGIVCVAGSLPPGRCHGRDGHVKRGTRRTA
jgi:hypothetical protein